MFLLCFSLGDERFALDTTGVVEITPVVSLKKIPAAPAWVAGIMRYRGRQVPVIDACLLCFAMPAKRVMSTRIIVVNFTTAGGEPQLLGLMAERVTDTLHCDLSMLADTGVKAAPYLGKAFESDDGLVQLVDCNSMLSEEVQSMLYQADTVVADVS